MKTPDWGRTAADFARHRAGFPESLFTRLAERKVGIPKQHVLDVGTGTGSLGRGFARHGCRVTGLDPAEPLLEQARRLDSDEGLKVDYVVGRAENTGFQAATCLVSNSTSRNATDPQVPEPGVVFHYLIRTRNACGVNLGTSSDGTPRQGATCPG